MTLMFHVLYSVGYWEYSAPSSGNNDVLNDGVILEMHSMWLPWPLRRPSDFSSHKHKQKRCVFLLAQKIDAGNIDESMCLED